MPRGTKRPPPKPMILEPNVVHVFTDGSCHRLTGNGGWASVLLWKDVVKEVSGAETHTTNNRMELSAILGGLRMIKEGTRLPVRVYSDSKYCVNSLSAWHHAWRRNGWVTATGTPVANRDLIEEITRIQPENTVYKWVKGHVGHVHNERCDELAGIQSKGLPIPTAEEIAQHGRIRNPETTPPPPVPSGVP